MKAKYKKVMLIDDNELDLYINSRLISNYNLSHDIIEFMSAEEALEYLSEYANDETKLPDLIFLDIYMPRMDGFEFIDRFRQLDGIITEHCKICIVSSTVSDYDIYKTKIDKGIPLFTSKPITKEFIESLVQD